MSTWSVPLPSEKQRTAREQRNALNIRSWSDIVNGLSLHGISAVAYPDNGAFSLAAGLLPHGSPLIEFVPKFTIDRPSVTRHPGRSL